MYTYIKKEIPGHYFRPQEPLTEENCDVLGSTFEDYLNGKFVPLNEEQIAFAEENPEASIKEIFEMHIEEAIPYVRTLEDAKNELKHRISLHDHSEEVNSFTVNGLTAWFTPTERANYKQSIEAAKLVNMATLQFFIEDNLLEVGTSEAEEMLALIQLYADKCYIVTRQHNLAVDKLETIEDVDNYDYTVGYPDKLEFTLSKE